MASIRKATAGDAPALAVVHVRSWQESYAHILSPDFLAGLSVEHRQRFWERILSDTESEEVAFVADQESVGVVGFALAGPARETADFDGEMYAIYLLAEYQRCGFGL